MKLSKLVVGPLAALLLAAGLVALGGAAPASALNVQLNHRPIACKRGADVIGGLQPDRTCGYRGSSGGGAWGDPVGGPSWGYDRVRYTDTKDMSAWEVLNNPLLFPTSDSIYDCIPSPNGSNLCSRAASTAPNDGITGARITQLKDEKYRGSVLSWVEDDTVNCSTVRQCFKTTVVFPHYIAEAFYTYGKSGELDVPIVWWYRNDDKKADGPGTFLGASRGFLTSGLPDAELEPANSASVSSQLNPGQVAAKGERVDYTVTVRAATGGSSRISLRQSGLKDVTEDAIPADWIRVGALGGEYTSYLIPHLDPGETSTAKLHFTVDGYRSVFVGADVNGTTTSSGVDVVPEAPECSTSELADGHPVAIAGSQATVLAGLHCAVASDATLEVFVPVGRDIKKLSIDGDTIRYVPPTDDFRGRETLYVLARNPGGIASTPTPVTVNVVDKATPVDDEYTVKMEERTTLDAAHGLMSNDTFPGGTDGWSVVSNGVEADGAIRIGDRGELEIEPGRHFEGDLTFQYKLSAPHGQGTDLATVTIHVVE